MLFLSGAGAPGESPAPSPGVLFVNQSVPEAVPVMRAIEKYYTTAEVAVLLSVSKRTVMRRLKEFGAVVDLGSDGNHDYRIPASGVNAYLDPRQVFSEPGTSAQSVGELKRKSAVSGR